MKVIAAHSPWLGDCKERNSAISPCSVCTSIVHCAVALTCLAKDPFCVWHTLGEPLSKPSLVFRQVPQGQLSRLEDLAATFDLTALLERIATARAAPETDKLELRHAERVDSPAAEEAVLAVLPLITDRLLSFLDTGQWADVALCVAGQGEVVRAHRVVLSAWSAPMCRVRMRPSCHIFL